MPWVGRFTIDVGVGGVAIEVDRARWAGLGGGVDRAGG